MSLNKIAANLNQTLSLYSDGVVDKFGKVTYGAAVSYPCRFQKVTRTMVTPQHELTPIDGIVFLGPDTIVDIGYKLTFDSKDYKVMSVEPLVDGRGRIRHYELKVQRFSL